MDGLVRIIVISRETEEVFYRLRNQTDELISFHQQSARYE
jgi:hypothetical protein